MLIHHRAIATPPPGAPPLTLRNRIMTFLANREDHGSAVIEIALTMPLLLLMFTGITAFGLTISNYQMLLHGTLVGTQALAISRGQSLDPCATAAGALYLAVPNLSDSKLTFTFVINGTTFNGPTCSSSSTSTGAAGDMVQDGTASMTVTYPCSLQVYKANNFPNCTLTASSTELIQ
jgi:Flp pilus assembly protein TadG